MKKRYFHYLFRRAELLIVLLVIYNVVLTGILISFTELKKGGIYFLCFMYLLLVAFALLSYYFLYLPKKETEKSLILFSEGYYYTREQFEVKYPYSEGTELANHHLKELFDTKDLINVSKKEAEYLALQNQINPHFLYNTLEGIRSEALVAGIDNVADMAEALGRFFRYTISQVDREVTVEDELSNVENYYFIQQFRFGGRIHLEIDFMNNEEKKILKYRIPKLTLQPIVENAIFHGVERKIGKGTLFIRIDTTASKLLINISDDGLGMSEEKVSEINETLKSLKLKSTDVNSDAKGGIALVNVNNRIKLLFGEEYGIYIYSTLNVGTEVEISLPLLEG